MLVRNYVLVILLFFQISEFYAQEHKGLILSGIVKDSLTGQGLQNASVLLININSGTITDKNGKFSIQSIPEGSYTIRVTYVGFKVFQQEIILNKKSSNNLLILLSDSIFTPDIIVIKAERPLKLSEQTFRTNIVNSDFISNTPAQQITDVMDYMPGVSISNTTGIYSGKTNVTMRGVPGNDQSRTLIILDGVVLNKADLGSVNWNAVNKNDIEEIKIFKGPGPAKYGGGAMGGVIEMTSAKPIKKFNGNAGFTFGSYNTISSSLNLSGKLQNKSDAFFWGLAVTGRQSDGYITEPEQFIENADSILVPSFLKEFNAGIKAGYSFADNSSIELKYDFFDDTRGTGVKVFDDFGGNSKHKNNRGTLKYSRSFKKSTVSVLGFYSCENYDRLYEYLKEGEYMLYMADAFRTDKGLNIDFSYNGFQNNELIAGLSYQGGEVNGADIYFTSTDVVRNNGTMNSLAFYVQNGFKILAEKLIINTGFRYDLAKFSDGHFSIENPSYTIDFYKDFENSNVNSEVWNELSPRLSLLYRFNSFNSMYWSVAKGFRAPVLDDMCRTGKKRGGFKVANPYLKPENLYSYEWGGDAKIAFGLSGAISVYYSRGYDFMYYTGTGDTVNMGYKLAPVVSKQNIGKVEIYGAECELKYEFDKKLSLFANYAYTNSMIIEHNINTPSDSNLTGKYLTDIPLQKFSAGLSWKNKIVNTFIMYKFVGKAWINDYNSVDEEYLLSDRYAAYGLLSLRLSKDVFKKVRLSINVENVFDKMFIDGDVQRNPGRLITSAVNYIF